MKKRAPAEEAERDVLVAIGRWALGYILMNRVELADQMFKDVVQEFNGRWPHHKMLSDFWEASREPKDMGNVPSESPLLPDHGKRGPDQVD